MNVVQGGKHQAAPAGWKCESPLLSPASIIHDLQEALEGKEKNKLYFPFFFLDCSLVLNQVTVLSLLFTSHSFTSPWGMSWSIISSLQMQFYFIIFEV